MAEDIWKDFLPGKTQDPWAEFAPTQKNYALKDVPLAALKNAPRSAYDFIGNIVDAVSHPLDTASALGDVVSGFINKTGRPGDLLREWDAAPTPQEIQQRQQIEAGADRVGQFYADRFGGWENIKRTLAEDPVGALADAVSVVAPAASATKLPIVGAASRATPLTVAGRTVEGAAKLAEPVVSNALGFSTGAGADAVRQAFKAGREGQTAFVENMRGNVPMTDVLDQAKSALGQLRDERNAAYQKGMAGVRNDATVLDLKGIEDALQNTQQVGTYGNKVINPEAVATREKLAALLQDWKGSDPNFYHTPAGLDALKQAVGAVMEKTDPHTRARNVVGDVYRATGDAIKAQAPTYADTMAGYADASNRIKEIERTFSLGEKAAQDTGMRKLQSVMRNNVNTNFGNREALANALAEKAPDLKAAIAGQAMNSVTPRGIAKLGPWASVGAATMNPAYLATLLLESPRLVGEALYASGRGAGALQQAAPTANAARLAELLAMQSGRMKEQGAR
jgi:hypothetical protein